MLFSPLSCRILSNYGICRPSPTFSITQLTRQLSSTEVADTQWTNLIVDKQVDAPYVTHIKLDRPEKKNAISIPMWESIGRAFREAASDPECRSVVISSTSSSTFTAGIDLTELSSLSSLVLDKEMDIASKVKRLHDLIVRMQSSFTAIEKCPKPVVAAVNGSCVGAGVDLITACDIRLSSTDAWFQVKEVDLGLAADVGTLQRLPKVVGSQSLVRDLCFTGRKMLSDEALHCGLVSRVSENHESLVEAAINLAANIAKKSPVAVQGTKIALNHARDHSVDEGLEFIAKHNATMLLSRDLMAAVMSAMTKQDPKFDNL